jgi:hypothetical protein
MAENDDHDGAQVLDGIFETPNSRRFRTVSSNADNEKIAEPLIKHDFRWNPAVRTT